MRKLRGQAAVAEPGSAAEPAWPADRVERRAVSELIPYARNARTHSPEQIAQIAASVREWGWTVPVLIDEEGGIIAGHGRVLAAHQLGLTMVPTMVATGWSEAQKRAYVLADNQLATKAGWDQDLLALEVSDLQELGFDVEVAGFEAADLKRMFGAGDGAVADDAGSYQEQYGVMVICKDAGEQESVYNALQAEGYKLKVVTT